MPYLPDNGNGIPNLNRKILHQQVPESFSEQAEMLAEKSFKEG